MAARKSAGPKTTNAQIRRVFAIFRVLSRARGPLTLDQIVSKMWEFGLDSDDTGMSKRNLERDISFIRSGMNYEIHKEEYGYIMESRGDSGDLLPLFFEKKEVQALMMGQELFQPFQHTHLADSIDSVYDKILKCYTGKRRMDTKIDEFDEMFILQPPPTRSYKKQREIVGTLMEAITSTRVVQITHNSDKSYKIRPYKFVIHYDTLYLLATTEFGEEKEFRLLLLPRLKSAVITDETFKPKSTSEYEKKMKDAFKVLVWGDKTHVSIQFKPELADYLEERVWHRSQKLTRVGDKVQLEMDILLNFEVCRWILGFGHQVVKMEPKALRDMVKKAKDG